VSRRRAVTLGVALLVAAGGAGAALAIRQRSDATEPPSSIAIQIATATVVRTDLAATQRINATLGFAPSQPPIVRRPGTYTALPAEGTVLTPGNPIAAVDGRPVILLHGAVPAWRALHLGVADGADVGQLERALGALGFGTDLNGDDHFDGATAAAVRRWQEALGEAVTGAVDDGDVVFLPASVRVGQAHVSIGSPSQVGQAPFDVTSTVRSAQADLDASRQQGINVGDQVTIDLPGGGRTAGRVATLGRVATAGRDDGNGSTGRATVPLSISLDKPGAAGALDQVPVQIELVTAARSHVLAVPITALLAMADGTYGVEVVPATGPHRIVAVTIGLSAAGLVEVTSPDVVEGTVVVVAK